MATPKQIARFEGLLAEMSNLLHEMKRDASFDDGHDPSDDVTFHPPERPCVLDKTGT